MPEAAVEPAEMRWSAVSHVIGAPGSERCVRTLDGIGLELRFSRGRNA